MMSRHFLLLMLLLPLARSANGRQHASMPRGLQSTVPGNDTELCLLQHFYQIAVACKPRSNWTGYTSTTRADVVKLLYACVFLSTATGAINAPTFFLVRDAATNMQIFAHNTGFQVNMPVIPMNMYTYWSQAALAQPDRMVTVPGMKGGEAGSGPPAVYTYVMSQLGQGYQSGALMDLSAIVASDEQLQWTAVLPNLRTNGVLFGGKVLGTIYTAYTNTLVYRTDLFKLYKLTVPKTWHQVLALATLMNGTHTTTSRAGSSLPPDVPPPSSSAGPPPGGNLLGFCMNWNCVQPAFWMRYMMGSMMQTEGPSQGWLLDPVTLESHLGGSEALIDTLVTLRALHRLMLNASGDVDDGGCDSFWLQRSFLAGRCLMGFDVPRVFKVASMKGSPYAAALRGKLGFAPAPGSIQVLDRGSNKLVYCTPALCPSATETTADQDGVQRLVNRAPPVDAILMGVNEQLVDDVKFLAYNLMSYAVSDPRLTPLLYDNQSVVLPFRDDQFDALAWMLNGYHPEDTVSFLAAVATSLNHPNIMCNFRSSSAAYFDNVLLAAIINYTATNNTRSAYDVSVLTERGIQAVVAASGDDFQVDYWHSLNFVPDPPPPPPPGTPQPLRPPAKSRSRVCELVLATALPAVALLGALALLALVTWRCLLPRYRYLLLAPGPGPATTLVVTDIQSSTTLWECLSQEVMESSMSLHHACIRRLAAEYHGYEGHTEGDSFILAFHNPADATHFSLDLQKALMAVEWPQALLDHPECQAVWVTPHGRSDLAVRLSACMASASVSALACDARRDSSTMSYGDLRHLFARVRACVLRAAAPPAELPPCGLDLMASTLDAQDVFEGHLLDTSSATGHCPPQPLPSLAVMGLSNTLHLGRRSRLDGGTVLLRAWQVHFSMSKNQDGQGTLVFRGLRVRVGIHVGLVEGEVLFDKRFGRTRYQGHALSQAKAIGDVGPGGMITFAGQAVDALRTTALQDPAIVLLSMGEHQVRYGSETVHIQVFQALSRDLVGRQVAFQPLSLRSDAQLTLGAWEAPWGCGTLAVIQAVGVEALLQWDRTEAEAALVVLRDLGHTLLGQHHGFAVNFSQDGKLVASFSESSDAVSWVMAVQQVLQDHPWSNALLTHAMCHPRWSGADHVTEGGGGGGGEVLGHLQGVGTKAGIYAGLIKGAVHADSGAVAYDSAAMDKVTRLVDMANTGQVLATQRVHEMCQLSADLSTALDVASPQAKAGRQCQWDLQTRVPGLEPVYSVRALMRPFLAEQGLRALQKEEGLIHIHVQP